MKKTALTFLVLALFGMAMGLLETIVVVYLRELYYPDGFHFPLAWFPPRMMGIELLRELATLVMLGTIGILAGKTRMQKFAFFIFTFAVWDIFYYLGLKGLLDWPASLLTWDILFLIPVTWVGPVLAPLICSLTMILLAWEIIHFQEKELSPLVTRVEWSLIIAGAFNIWITFVWDYSVLLWKGGYLSRLSTLSADPAFQKELTTYVPAVYHWEWFAVGEGLILLGMIMMMMRFRISQKNTGNVYRNQVL